MRERYASVDVWGAPPGVLDGVTGWGPDGGRVVEVSRGLPASLTEALDRCSSSTLYCCDGEGRTFFLSKTPAGGLLTVFDEATSVTSHFVSDWEAQGVVALEVGGEAGLIERGRLMPWRDASGLFSDFVTGRRSYCSADWVPE